MSECSLRHCGKLRKFQVSTRRTLRVRVTHALRCVSALRIARWGSLEGPTQGLQTLGGRRTRTIRPAQAPGRRIGARLPAVSYTHLRAHETDSYLVCRLLLEKKKTTTPSPRAPASPVLLRFFFFNDTATTEIYTLHIVGSVRCV